MPAFTVQCTSPAHYTQLISVVAEYLDSALEKAIEAANDSPGKNAVSSGDATNDSRRRYSRSQ